MKKILSVTAALLASSVLFGNAVQASSNGSVGGLYSAKLHVFTSNGYTYTDLVVNATSMSKCQILRDATLQAYSQSGHPASIVQDCHEGATAEPAPRVVFNF